MGYELLPERRKIKPIGEYIIPPPFKYTLWDFLSGVLKPKI